MTINGRPRDGEEIVVSQVDALGTEKLVGTNALNRFFEELTDAINSSESSTPSSIQVSGLASRVADIESSLGYIFPSLTGLLRSIASQSFTDVEVSSNYTANDWEDIDATGAITIKFPASPSGNCEVIIGNGDGKRKIIDGNGRNIKRLSLSSTLATARKGTRLHFRYKIDKNIWVLV